MTRDKAIPHRLRKSSSPSRWLMGLPPTSPRLKFVHTHPGGTPVPRRPPRHPTSPSTRSRSLELLEQEEQKSVSPATIPEPLPRPRSRSLDGLLDEDGIIPDIKTEESLEQSDDKMKSNEETQDDPSQMNQEEIPKSSNIPDIEIQEANDAIDTQSQVPSEEDSGFESRSGDNPNPLPIPRARAKISNTPTSKLEIKPVQQEKQSLPSCNLEGISNEEEVTKPPKPSRVMSADEKIFSVNSIKEEEVMEEEKEATNDKTSPVSDRLMTTTNEKTTLLKAKSCGAGLDSDESISSNEYKPKVKGQGSLLSLPTGAEPKRKKNFMDKCVNKVRSFMKK